MSATDPMTEQEFVAEMRALQQRAMSALERIERALMERRLIPAEEGGDR